MEQLIAQIIDLTYKSLNQELYVNKIDDDQSFYHALVDNGLVGLVFNHIDKKSISHLLYQNLSKVYYAYIAADLTQLKIIDKLNDLFNSHQIKHIFLKGTHLKTMYPESYMRAMGDIDVLVQKDDMQKIYQIFNNNHIKLISKSECHDQYKTSDNVSIEIHQDLYKESELIFQKNQMNPWKYCRHKVNDEYELEVEYELMYLLYHLSKHIKSSGVGIRSVLDIGIFVSNQESSIDFNKLSILLLESKLQQFYDVILQINQDYFGLAINQMINRKKTDSTRLKEIMLYFAFSGIHGKAKNNNTFEARIATHRLEKKSRFAFYVSLFFPNFRVMKHMYPILEKWALLLPFLWVYRIFKKLFLNTKMSLNQLFKSIVKKEKITYTQSIIKDLGL